MKTSLLSATALIATATYSRAADCDIAKIESRLYPNATEGLASCAEATGIDIFAVSQFPTSDQVASLSENMNCVNYYNQINQVANAEIQCNVTVGGVSIVFGELIADFLMSKTGNETDKKTDAPVDTIEFMSESASESKDTDSPDQVSPATKSDSASPSTSTVSVSASSTQLTSYLAYGFATAVIIALQ